MTGGRRWPWFVLAAAAGAFLTLSIVAAAAQALRLAPVRAVEHPEYSRLVVPMGEQVTFSLIQTGAIAELRLEGAGPALDTRGVFERMPRTRLLAVDSVGPDANDARLLRLTLGCSCKVTAEALGSGFLAIDVRRVGGAEAPEQEHATPDRAVHQGRAPVASAPDDTVAETEQATTAEKARALLAPIKGSDGAEPGAARLAGGRILRPLRTLPQIGDDLRGPETGPEFAKPLELDAAPKTGPLPTADRAEDASGMIAAAERADPVLSARQSLLRELSRAAQEGILSIAPDAETELAFALEPAAPDLLDGAPDVPAALLTPQRAEGLIPLDTPATPPRTPRLSAGLAPHITVRGPSRAYPDVLTAATAEDRPLCVEDAALDVQSWSLVEGSFSDRLGDLRRMLVDSSGAVDAGTVADLARYYIANGFGREAAVILRAMGSNVSGRALLADLAELVEGRPPAPDGPVSGSEAADCIGRITLWRAAGGLQRLDFDTPSGQEIARALEELPPALRRQVGQAVARHALLDGAPDAARRIIGFLDRTPGLPGAAETRVRAELALAEGLAAETVALLKPAVMDRASPDPRTLAVFAEAVLAGGGSPDEGLSATLRAVAAPLPMSRGTGLALRVLKAQVDAAGGAPLSALAELRELAATGEAAEAKVVVAAREIMTAFDPLGHPPEIAARVIIENRAFLGDDRESAGLRQTYAAALLDAGLPAAALDVLSAENRLPTGETRLLAAAAQLQLGAPEKALLTLAPVRGETAARLRADAHVRQGNVVAGFEALEPLGPGDPERQRLALLAGRWDALDDPADADAFAGLARYAMGTQESLPTSLDTKQTGLTRDIAEAALAGARGLQAALEDLPADSIGEPRDGRRP